MSSKHPLTEEAVTLDGKGTRSYTADETSDYSGSGEPAIQLLQWKRRPYEIHAYPQSHSTNIIGGVTNRIALELGHSSSTNQVGDLDFDAKPSATYQSITPQQDESTTYEDVSKLSKKGGSNMREAHLRRPTRGLKCSVCVLGFVAVLALLVACGGIALAGYGIFVPQQPQDDDDRISDLETQLSNSKMVIEQLTSMIEDLRQNVSASVDSKNAKINQLSLEISEIHKSVDEIINSSNATVTDTSKTFNMSQSCSPVSLIETCNIPQHIVTTVSGSNEDFPNFSGCTTSGSSVNVTGMYIQDIYCAITNPRDEDNPIMTTLRYDEDTNTFICYCFVTAFKERGGVVQCGLFVKRCNDIVQV